ncbi:MAG TPA: hypothetical protein VMS65_06870 [Polyangiaceae bacterium]|nr:hypothetical protein [Polyangiaceae bacterium]
MKALGKLLGDFVAWRWAPAVGLCVASLFYVLVVVALVPDEIGVPVSGARMAKKRALTTDEKPELPTFPTTTPEPETEGETQPVSPPPSMPVQPAGVVDFGRRGFSPPLERPDPPPEPPPVMMPPPPVAAPPPVAEAPVPAEAPPAAVAEAPAVSPSGPSATPRSPSGMMRQMQAFRGLMPRNTVPHAPGQQPGQQPTPGEAPPEPSAPPSQ